MLVALFKGPMVLKNLSQNAVSFIHIHEGNVILELFTD